jgi:hypothetical protein
MGVEPSPEIWHRNDLSVLCNWRRLTRAVEVGVDRGEFARAFLDRWMGEEYFGVDAYLPYGEMDYPREADYLFAVNNLAPHSRRAKLLRMGSVEAARLFQPGSVDFVYIDAAHDAESVREDLRAWWPILSEQGIFAGHDWDDQPVHAGVKQAVMGFATEIGQTIYLTAVPGYGQEPQPSWYFYKSGMPGSDWKRC